MRKQKECIAMLLAGDREADSGHLQKISLNLPFPFAVSIG